MKKAKPVLREWNELKPPNICTVSSLGGSIPLGLYSHAYWIKTIRPSDNVILETHPLKTWQFTPDGRLIGEVDTGIWQQIVEIDPDEYILLSLK